MVLKRERERIKRLNNGHRYLDMVGVDWILALISLAETSTLERGSTYTWVVLANFSRWRVTSPQPGTPRKCSCTRDVFTGSNQTKAR